MISSNSNINDLNGLNKNTLMEQLGIEYMEVREGFVKAKMPVDIRTIQPMGILHGGASLALAETISGLGSSVLVDLSKYDVKGASCSANHVGSISEGFVYGYADIIHKGRFTHVWNVDIKDENGRMISTCRFTIMIVENK